MSLKGTQTEKNLLAVFAGESQARNRYDFFASKAKKEGFVQVSDVFLETAVQEQAHASRVFKFLEGGEVQVTASWPAGVNGTTLENLRAAAAGERHEWSELYPAFARKAREEGQEAAAMVLEAICVAEQHHERRFRHFLGLLESGRMFRREKPVTWRCRHCGWTREAAEAPLACPACGHPQAHFEVYGEAP